jgi:hypothetical protein
MDLLKHLDEGLLRSDHPDDSPAIECEGRHRPPYDHTPARIHFSHLLIEVTGLVAGTPQTGAFFRQDTAPLASRS